MGLIGLAARPVLSVAARLLDDAVPADRIQSFLLRKYGKLCRTVGRRDNDARGLVWQDLARVDRLLRHVHGTHDAPACRVGENHLNLCDSAAAWLRNLPDGRVLLKGRLVAGTGRHLDWLDSIGDAAFEPAVAHNTERLLVHIETRRKRCLAAMLELAGPEAIWIERHDVAIFLARRALRRCDLRCLSTAMKLNDWAFPAHRGRVPPIRLARYLVALAEQEHSAGELLA